ncbi:hypothetical protein H0H93_012739 [Arthromyces matolae]|nr:hypothetical protein H0H93_012739 [Arthromyces matolae]
MIFKAKLVQAVAVACIFHIALGIPIHANGPEDRDTTQPYPLQPRNPQPTQIQSQDAFQRFDTPQNPNSCGSSASVDPNVLSIRDSLDPRSPAGDTPQSLAVPPVQNPRIRLSGLLTKHVPGSYEDKLAKAVESDRFRTRISKDLLAEWEKYLAEYPDLRKFYERVYCMTAQAAELRSLVNWRSNYNANLHLFGSRETVAGLASDPTCSNITQEAAREILGRIDGAPSKKGYEEVFSKTEAIFAEENFKTDARLLAGWRLRRDLIFQMCKRMDSEEYKKSCEEIVSNQLLYLDHYFPPERASAYPTSVQVVAKNFKQFLVETEEKLKGRKEPFIDLTGVGNKRRKL